MKPFSITTIEDKVKKEFISDRETRWATQWLMILEHFQEGHWLLVRSWSFCNMCVFSQCVRGCFFSLNIMGLGWSDTAVVWMIVCLYMWPWHELMNCPRCSTAPPFGNWGWVQHLQPCRAWMGRKHEWIKSRNVLFWLIYIDGAKVLARGPLAIHKVLTAALWW